METRQEEEINELQSALEDAKKRLHVKEAEASWWKDTAYIVSEHIPKPSRITSNSQTRCYSLSSLPFALRYQTSMQAAIRSFVSGGNVVKASLLQHLRVINPAIQPSSVFCTRSESTQTSRMEEHGFESTTISDVMKAKGKSADGSWLWCTTDDTVYDAVKSMTQHNVGALVVVKPGEQQSLAGIITERDYLRKIIVQGRSSKSTKVGDIMTEENKLITVTPETKVLRAMQLMTGKLIFFFHKDCNFFRVLKCRFNFTDNRIRHIPVIKDKGMVGMVSIGDVVRAVVTEHREELNRLNAFIQGAMAIEFRRSAIAFTLLLSFIHVAHSFYLPGVAPQDFEKGDELKVKVNKLTSIKTQLPYSYYSLPFCQPKKIVDSTENLGEVLRGDRIENAPYSFKMREAKMCNVLCRVTLDAKTAKAFKEKIDDEYRVNMILDNLPLVVPIERGDQGSPPVVYQLGYHVGLKGQYEGSKEQKYFMHNHLAFTVRYHLDMQTDSARIVGFEVKPYSVKHEYDGEWSEKARLTTCDPHKKRLVVSSSTPQEVEPKKEIIFTYDVEFEASICESEVKWASRWDAYLLMSDNQIHWFSIVNSLMIVLFLSGMVAMIMLRTLYRDISRYNELETQEEAQEETGWKLVHGDVFRLPANSDLLCVYVGTGVQCLGMVFVTMIFAMLGFLSPSNRGGLMTAMLLLWVFMGLFAGYAASRLYKMFKGTEWKRIAFRTAFLFPAVVSSIFFVLNALIWGQKSSGAVPFGTMFALIFLWFGISVPLVFVGAYLGFKKPPVDDPVKTNKIPRQIPEQAWYMNPIFSILIGGILPFGAVFIELFFILTSIWLNQFYYIFGFLFLVFVILIVTCAEITVVLCYFQLCSEDYLWWWRSYLTSGSSALYLFLYATFYFFTKLQITKLVSAMLYFGYMLIASYAFFVLTGTIGFYACLWFTRLIYSSVKID
ncbi:unnamed protein product [Brassica rapa]|uniref:Transmembrane 9 superfamily member n=1 Tax=Brassica campestris TaxID=3711 RepID=A0A8D9H4H7_BRACM|nr:unnamed protein product [Brassica rapa]